MREYIRLCRRAGFFRTTHTVVRAWFKLNWQYPLWIAAGALVIGVLYLAGQDAAEQAETNARIEATAVVDATVIEMRGYGPDGEPGRFLYDCEHTDNPQPDTPTLVCTQREETP